MRRPIIVLAVVAAMMAAMGSATAQPSASEVPAHQAPAAAAGELKLGASEPGPLAPDLSSTSAAEDVIPPVAEHIFELGTGRGFVSQTTDYDARSIVALWRGEVPADVQAYADSTPFGVTVTVNRGARYSREEGNAAAVRILEDPIARVIGVVSASVNHDGSGVTLGITLAALTDVQLAHLARLSGLAPGEITINGGREFHEGYASRQNDTNPWKGGATG